MKMPFGSLWAEFKAFAFKGNMIELAVAVVIGAAFSTVINSLVSDVIMPTVGYVVNTATTAAEKVKDVAADTAGKVGVMSTQPTTAPAEAAAGASAPAAPGATVPAATTPPSVEATSGMTQSQILLAEDLKAAVAAVSAADQKAAAEAKAKADAEAAKTAPVKINLMLGPVNVGAFIGALLNFIIVAAAVFVMIVKLLGGVMKRMNKPAPPGEPTTRECPKCLSIIPIKATKCSHCTTDLVPA